MKNREWLIKKNRNGGAVPRARDNDVCDAMTKPERFPVTCGICPEKPSSKPSTVPTSSTTIHAEICWRV